MSAKQPCRLCGRTPCVCVTLPKCIGESSAAIVQEYLRVRDERDAAFTVLREAPQVLCDTAQLMDGWHADIAWTEWDESVRDSIATIARRVDKLLHEDPAGSTLANLDRNGYNAMRAHAALFAAAIPPLRALVDAYRAMPDGPLGRGLTNHHFYCAEAALAAIDHAQQTHTIQPFPTNVAAIITAAREIVRLGWWERTVPEAYHAHLALAHLLDAPPPATPCQLPNYEYEESKPATFDELLNAVEHIVATASNTELDATQQDGLAILQRVVQQFRPINPPPAHDVEHTWHCTHCRAPKARAVGLGKCPDCGCALTLQTPDADPPAPETLEPWNAYAERCPLRGYDAMTQLYCWADPFGAVPCHFTTCCRRPSVRQAREHAEET